MRAETFTIREQIFLSVLIVFLSLVFSILAAELILRLAYCEQEVTGVYWGTGAFRSHESTGYVHAPGYEGYAFRSGIFNSPVKINQLSLRQRDLEEQLHFAKHLLVLGDSFAFGLGVLEEQSFPSLVKSYLNARGFGVINAAQTGYSVEQERLFGVSIAERIKPDSIILNLFAENDVEGDYFKEYQNVDIIYGHRLRKDRWFGVEPIDYLRTHSYLWMLVKRVLNSRKGHGTAAEAHFRTLLNTSPSEVMKPTFDAILKLRDYCESNHIIFGVVMIPPKSGATMFDEHLNTFFQDKKIAALDLGFKGFDKHDYFFEDGHWNESGHKKAAGFLIPFIAGLLEERRK
jgi:hypothetical protein